MIVAEAKPRPLPEMLALKDFAALPPPLAQLPPPTPVAEAAPDPAAPPPATAVVDAGAGPAEAPVAPPPAPVASDRPAAAGGEISQLLAKQAEDRKQAGNSEALKARLAERMRKAREARGQSQPLPPPQGQGTRP